MSNPVFSRIGRGLRWLWWLLDASRRALLNLMLLALIGALLWAWLRPGAPPVKPKTALVLSLAGAVREQTAGNPRDAALKQLQGRDEEGQIRLRDVLAVLDAAAQDPNIGHALLLLDDFKGAGLPTLREIANAIERFKAAGKPVYAWGAHYDQRAYLVAAHASQVWLHPMGTVMPEGFGRYRTYYKDAFDRFGLQANLIRVGKFKNAGEPYIANGPSPDSLEAERTLYDALWADATGSIEAARKLPAGSIARLINSLPASLQAVDGDPAKLVVQAKLADALMTRDEMRQRMIELGVAEPADKTFRQISFGAYLGRIKARTEGDAVGVVVAEGGISDGQAPPGQIGGLSTAALIRQAREDERIRAVVLRVNSPGGSVFGSELMRRELELTQKAGKPVVVSMGDLAASGGYWISTSADEVIADPATITGSIGVFAMLPNAQGALDKLGVHTGGYTTTWLAGALDPRRALDPRVATLVQTSIDRIYKDFTGLAAKARKTTPDKIDAVAQGRVWTGRQALAHGLVDRLGSYGDALDAAASRAKLPAKPRVVYLDREPGRLARLMQLLGISTDGGWGALLMAWADAGATPAAITPSAALAATLPAELLAPLQQDLGWLADLNRRRSPFDAVVHCLCTPP